MTHEISEPERLKGYLILKKLTEQVSPVPIGKAYLWKEEIMKKVQETMAEMAPNGVGSQGEFTELLEKVLNIIQDEAKAEFSQDEAKVADIELTLSMIERSLGMVPFQVFFGEPR